MEELEYKRHLIATINQFLEASSNEIGLAKDQFFKMYGSKYTTRIQEMRKDVLVITGLVLTFLGIMSAFVERAKANEYQPFLLIAMITAVAIGITIILALTTWKNKSSKHMEAVETGYLWI